jgi:hypothetical protein
MSERASVFGSGVDFDISGFAPQKPKTTPAPAPEKLKRVSEEANFKSREPEQKRPKREPRRYRTGRNAQFNVKADPVVIEDIYAISEAQKWVLGYTLERAVAALKREMATEAGQG